MTGLRPRIIVRNATVGESTVRGFLLAVEMALICGDGASHPAFSSTCVSVCRFVEILR
jgi:hypothetical protein